MEFSKKVCDGIYEVEEGVYVDTETFHKHKSKFKPTSYWSNFNISDYTVTVKNPMKSFNLVKPALDMALQCDKMDINEYLDLLDPKT